VDGTASSGAHDLLLAMAGRVDDDLLAWARELLAMDEDARAVELLTAGLLADRVILPHPVWTALVDVGRNARIDLDAATELPPPGPDEGTGHRFGPAPAGEDVTAAVRGLPTRQLHDCRAQLAWRRTPAGSAPGPLPRPVLLIEIEPDTRAADVLAYQLAASLDRAGVHVSVEVLTAGHPLSNYHAAALRGSRPIGTVESPADGSDVVPERSFGRADDGGADEHPPQTGTRPSPQAPTRPALPHPAPRQPAPHRAASAQPASHQPVSHHLLEPPPDAARTEDRIDSDTGHHTSAADPGRAPSPRPYSSPDVFQDSAGALGAVTPRTTSLPRRPPAPSPSGESLFAAEQPRARTEPPDGDDPPSQGLPAPRPVRQLPGSGGRRRTSIDDAPGERPPRPGPEWEARHPTVTPISRVVPSPIPLLRRGGQDDPRPPAPTSGNSNGMFSTPDENPVLETHSTSGQSSAPEPFSSERRFTMPEPFSAPGSVSAPQPDRWTPPRTDVTFDQGPIDGPPHGPSTTSSAPEQDGWSADWASGAWAMPQSSGEDRAPDDRATQDRDGPAPRAAGGPYRNGSSPTSEDESDRIPRHRFLNEVDQDASSPVDEARRNETAAPLQGSDVGPGSPDGPDLGLRPEQLARLTDADRDLFGRLQAELTHDSRQGGSGPTGSATVTGSATETGGAIPMGGAHPANGSSANGRSSHDPGHTNGSRSDGSPDVDG